MTSELWIAVWAAILGIANLMVAAFAPVTKPGYLQWNAGPRDTPFDVGVVPGRLQRAFKNFMETYAFFALIVVALAFAGKSNDISIWGSRIYLIARVVYVPLYAIGVKGPRSAAFLTSLAGILMCLYPLFF